MFLYLQKGFLPCPLPLIILPLTMWLFTVLLFMLLPYLSQLLFPSPGLSKLTLLFFYLLLLVLIMPLSILLTFLGFFPPVGPSIFAGISSIPPYLGPSFPNTVPMPSQPLPPMTTLRSIPGPFSSTGPQSSFEPRPSRKSIRIPRGTPPGRR